MELRVQVLPVRDEQDQANTQTLQRDMGHHDNLFGSVQRQRPGPGPIGQSAGIALTFARRLSGHIMRKPVLGQARRVLGTLDTVPHQRRAGPIGGTLEVD